MAATRYVLFLETQNGYFLNFKEDETTKTGQRATVTFEIEKAKIYTTKRGAMDAATGLYDELPHLVTAEMSLEPVGMGDVITKTQILEAREEREVKKRERLLNKMEKERETALAAWNQEQGIETVK